MSNTKKSLIISAVSLIICVSLFVGSTVAWLTATMQSTSNKIQAGNLDVLMEYKNSTQTDYKTVDTTTNVFLDNVLWEPGHVEYAVLKVTNKGNIDFNYGLGVYVESEVKGTLVEGGEYVLSNYLKYAILDGDQYAAITETEESAIRAAMLTAAEKATNAVLANSTTETGRLYAKESGDKKNSCEYTLVVWMPKDVTANYKTEYETDGTGASTTQIIPTINLGITLTASQLVSESDSFGNTYDSDADESLPWNGSKDTIGLAKNTDSTLMKVSIESAEQLAALADAVNEGTEDYGGYVITLAKNLDLNGDNKNWTPIGTAEHPFKGTFDGNNKTISNLKISMSGVDYAGLFGYITGTALVKDLTIVKVNATGKDYVGAVVGYFDASTAGISDCDVSGNISITGVNYVGGICGYSTGKITDCDVTASTEKLINGTDYVGGIVGCYASSLTLSTCSVSGVAISGTTVVGGVVGLVDYSGDVTIQQCTVAGTIAGTPAGAVYGSAGANTTVESVNNNTTAAKVN